MSFYFNILKNLGQKSKKKSTERKQTMSVKEMMNELGVRTESTLGTYEEEEKPDSISISQYIQMQENDGTIRAITRLFSMPIQSTEIKILPAKKDKGERDFIETVFMKPQYEGGMSTPLPFVIADMTRAIFEGFRLYEKIPQVIADGKYKGKIGWRKLAPRSSDTIDLRSDEHGGFNGAHQSTFFGNKSVDVIIPPEKCILFTFQKERHTLYGESILKTAFYHYDKKHKLYYFAHKKAEADAIGVKILKLNKPFSDDEVDAAENAVDDLRANSRITLPTGFELEINRAGTGYNVLDMIEHHDGQMVLSTLTQALQMGTKQKYAYPYGKGFTTQSEFIMQMLHSVMKSMEDTINQWAIPQLIDWNFNSAQYPKIKLMPLRNETQEFLMKIFEDLIKKDPETYMHPAFSNKLNNIVAEKLGLEINIDESKDAMKAFETGKRKVFDKNKQPAKPTPEKVKQEVKQKAINMQDEKFFLEKFEAIGKEYAEKQLSIIK